MTRLGVGSRHLRIQLRELSVCSELVVGLEKGLNCVDVCLFDNGFPFTERTRGNLETCLGGHMASAQLRVGEGFCHEVSATLRRFNEVLAPFADIESVSPLLCRYEEHLSGFFG